MAHTVQANPEEDVDLIAIFKEYAAREEGLRELLGDNFARGHAQVELVCWKLGSLLVCNSKSDCSSTVKDLHSRCHRNVVGADSCRIVTVWHPLCGSLEVVCVASCVAAVLPLIYTSAAEVLQVWGEGLPCQLVMSVCRLREALCLRRLMKYF